MYKAKKLQCAFCDKDISKEIFASCAECDQLLLCLDVSWERRTSGLDSSVHS